MIHPFPLRLRKSLGTHRVVQSDDEEEDKEEAEAENHKDNELERRDKEILAWAKKSGEAFSAYFE